MALRLTARLRERRNRTACQHHAVSTNEGNLINEVQRDALNRQVPLADTLRKLVALGWQAGSSELREWASLELRGYLGSPVELPEYRKPAATLKVDAIKGNYQITGQQISPRFLPEFARENIGEQVPLVHSVGELEAMLTRAEGDGGSVKLTLPMGQDLLTLMNHESNEPWQQLTAIYWALSAPAIAGVLDRVRTNLVELVAEMRAGMPESAETPSAEVADQAMNVVIHGSGHRVNFTTATASGSGSHEVNAQGASAESPRVEAAWPGLRQELAELGVPEQELEALHTALLTDGDPNGELGEATNSWIGRLSSRVSTGAITIGTAASTEMVSHTILKALGLS